MRRGIPILLVISALTACGSKTSIEGTWKIERAVPAPWVTTGEIHDQAFAAEYLQATVTFTPSAIQGPGFLACSNPRYAYSEVPAEGLFQGGLADPSSENETAEATAKGLGFKAIPVQMVSTGCEHDIAFYFGDASRAAFALDNMIFWMARQK